MAGCTHARLEGSRCRMRMSTAEPGVFGFGGRRGAIGRGTFRSDHQLGRCVEPGNPDQVEIRWRRLGLRITVLVGRWKTPVSGEGRVSGARTRRRRRSQRDAAQPT